MYGEDSIKKNIRDILFKKLKKYVFFLRYINTILIFSKKKKYSFQFNSFYIEITYIFYK